MQRPWGGGQERRSQEASVARSLRESRGWFEMRQERWVGAHPGTGACRRAQDFRFLSCKQWKNIEALEA